MKSLNEIMNRDHVGDYKHKPVIIKPSKYQIYIKGRIDGLNIGKLEKFCMKNSEGVRITSNTDGTHTVTIYTSQAEDFEGVKLYFHKVETVKLTRLN